MHDARRSYAYTQRHSHGRRSRDEGRYETIARVLEVLAEIAEKTAGLLLSMQAAILFVQKELEAECDAKSQRATARTFN